MIKRILKALEILFCCAAVVLCGCAKSERAEVQTDFKAGFRASFHGLSLEGEVLNTRRGIADFSFSAPDTLSGLNLGYRDGTLQISRGSIKCTADEAYLPDASFCSLLREFFAHLARGEYETSDSGCTMTLNGNPCDFSADSGGLPLCLSSPENYLSVEFYNAEKID